MSVASRSFSVVLLRYVHRPFVVKLGNTCWAYFQSNQVSKVKMHRDRSLQLTLAVTKSGHGTRKADPLFQISGLRIHLVTMVPAGSPSRGGDVTVYVPDINQLLPPPFLLCSCVCFCLYSSFNCISFHKFSRQLSASSLCSSALIFLPYWSFQLFVFFTKVSLSPDIIPSG